MNQFLPFKYRVIGITVVVFAFLLNVAYFLFELRIESSVFAIVSTFLDTKFFIFFKTNIIEEIIIILFLVGFSLIVFSQLKNEKKWVLNIRIKSLIYTIFAYLIWLMITTIFIYGSAYISILIINIVLPFIIYLIVFYHLYFKACKRRKIRILQQKLFKNQKAAKST
jgi:hypothetical protein